LLLIAGSMIICLITVFQYNHTFNKAQEAQEAQEAFSDVTFKYGATGSDVRELQGRLKFLGFYDGKVDGDYGWKTLQSIKWFQWKFGMTADGIVGPKTKLMLWEATKKWSPELTMDKPTANPSNNQNKAGSSTGMTSSNNYGLSANDLKIMANAVHGEARGEPYIGQVAVAAVILNRVDSPSFPNTVSGVIFQPGAFTAVADGQIWLDPDESSERAVRDALNGWDPTGDCIYYFNPDTATSAWIWTRTQVKKIGKHIFAI
jgi:N-acetylmuramoyl-L-alanine amidase